MAFYDWLHSADGSRHYTEDMHILGGVTPLADGSFMVYVNIADRHNISIGAKPTREKAQKKLIDFLAIRQ